MQKKEHKNTEISERISKLIEALGIKPNAFALALGYNRSQTIYDIVKGKSAPSFDFFNKLAMSEYSEILNMDWVLTGRGEILLSKTPEKPYKSRIPDRRREFREECRRCRCRQGFQTANRSPD